MVDSLTDDGSYRAQQDQEAAKVEYINCIIRRMMSGTSTDDDARFIARELMPKTTMEKYETFRLD